MQFDEVALYSTTDPASGRAIARIVRTLVPRGSVVVDATACVGGSAYPLSQMFDRVIAIENDAVRFGYLVHNMGVLGAQNVRCVHGDMLEECPKVQSDVVFLDPPWGGPGYRSRQRVQLYISGRSISEVCEALRGCTRYIVLKVPVNFDNGSLVHPVHMRVMLRKMDIIILKMTDAEH